MTSNLPPVLDREEPKIHVHALRLLHYEDFGPLERIVRALTGLPIAASFLYVRHFHFLFALFLLVSGLYLVFTAAFHYCAVRHLVYWLRWKAFR